MHIDAVEPGAGPERKRYAITPAGVTDVERWLSESEKPEPYLQSTLYAKVVLALRGRPALAGADGRAARPARGVHQPDADRQQQRVSQLRK